MEEVYEFFKKCNAYYLATDDNGQPRVRIFGTVDIYNGKFYIQTGMAKPCAQQMVANPKVELIAWDGKTWIRVAGEAIRDTDIAAEEHMLEAYPSLKNRYQAGDGNTAVFYIQNATATVSSFAGDEKVITW